MDGAVGITYKTLCNTYGAASGPTWGAGETMLSQDLIVAPTQGRPPALIEGSGRKARDRIEHFLRAAIDNDNTRRAYGRAVGSFFAFLEDGGRARIQDIGPLDVRDYLEAAKANGLSTATLKQHMAAIRMLLDHLVTGAVLEHNPALSVKAPRQKLGKGKTPILTAEEAGDLLRSIVTDNVVGLRDRALIGVMVFTFARVSAACGLNVADIFHQQRRLWVRLHEKGGEFHEMPCHHTLEGYLAAISNSRLISADQTGVTFRYKDYRIEGPDRYKTMTLAPAEFIRRFMLHVLPKGFHRIRQRVSLRH
jgi:site-specific recombinase XerC